MTFPFTLRAEVYAGKPHEPGPYYIKSVEEITLQLIDKYSDICEVQGRNLTTDNLYTPISLGKNLLNRGMTLVGTLRQNRKGLHKEMKDLEGREVDSTVTWWEKEKGKITITSYIVNRKSKGKKNILLLSTLPLMLRLTRDDNKKKPQIIMIIFIDQRLFSMNNKWDLIK